MSQKGKILLGVVVAIIVAFCLCWLSNRYDIGLYIGICGSIASLFGVWVAYLQIKSVKDISRETKDAIDTKVSGLNKFLTLTDMTRVISLAKDAKSYVATSKLEIASVRLSDLKLDLVLLRKNDKLLKLSEAEKMNSIINDIGLDIVNINSYVKKRGQLSLDVIETHLEETLTLLADLEGQLKYQEL